METWGFEGPTVFTTDNLYVYVCMYSWNKTKEWTLSIILCPTLDLGSVKGPVLCPVCSVCGSWSWACSLHSRSPVFTGNVCVCIVSSQ